MGYALVITEFDVKDNALPADTAIRDAGVAAYAGAYLDLMLSLSSSSRTCSAGASTTNIAGCRASRPARTSCRCAAAPMIPDGNPKPLYRAIEGVVAGRASDADLSAR